MSHRGNHTRGAVGGRGDHASAGCVLFVDGHGVDGDPVERGQRIAAQAIGFLLAQTAGEAMRAAANIQSAGQNAFRGDAPFNAGAHRLPDALDAFANDLDWRLD